MLHQLEQQQQRHREEEERRRQADERKEKADATKRDEQLRRDAGWAPAPKRGAAQQ
eukprot:gene42362-46714_t